MTRRGQGVLLALAIVLGIALVAGGVAVLARSGGASHSGTKIVGTNGPNRLIGNARPNIIDGLGAGDVLKGRRGDDVLNGGSGPDRLNGGPGFDRLRGGPGNDRIQARDGHADEIDCGPGRDTVEVDRAEDGVYDCERVKLPQTFQGGKRK
jgi:Ca2+-binding RTX toxin-like protein